MSSSPSPLSTLCDKLLLASLLLTPNVILGGGGTQALRAHQAKAAPAAEPAPIPDVVKEGARRLASHHLLNRLTMMRVDTVMTLSIFGCRARGGSTPSDNLTSTPSSSGCCSTRFVVLSSSDFQLLPLWILFAVPRLRMMLLVPNWQTKNDCGRLAGALRPPTRTTFSMITTPFYQLISPQ